MKKVIISTCYCSSCGNKMFVPRTNQREKEHVKDMYCPYCFMMEVFIEIRQFDYISHRDLEILEKGILTFYYEKYRYDFLKFLIYLPNIQNEKELENVLIFTCSLIEAQQVKEHYNLLKKVILSHKRRRSNLYKNILYILENKTMFITKI